MSEDRSHIRTLAAAIFVQHNGKLKMQDCLNVAEIAFMEADHVDAEKQQQLDEEEKAAARVAKPLTDQVQ